MTEDRKYSHIRLGRLACWNEEGGDTADEEVGVLGEPKLP